MKALPALIALVILPEFSFGEESYYVVGPGVDCDIVVVVDGKESWHLKKYLPDQPVIENPLDDAVGSRWGDKSGARGGYSLKPNNKDRISSLVFIYSNDGQSGEMTIPLNIDEVSVVIAPKYSIHIQLKKP